MSSQTIQLLVLPSRVFLSLTLHVYGFLIAENGLQHCNDVYESTIGRGKLRVQKLTINSEPCLEACVFVNRQLMFQFAGRAMANRSVRDKEQC